MSARKDRVVSDGLAEGQGSPHAADLHLASGCARGDRAALSAFERRYLAEFAGYLASEKDGSVVDEIAQRVRTHLLLGVDGKLPRIADYAGRGPLGAWLRVVAVRAYLDYRREVRRASEAAADHDADEAPESVSSSPEIAAVRARFHEPLEGAMRGALLAIAERDRTILALLYERGMTQDEIAAHLDVDKSTVSRRLVAARARILEELWARVPPALGLGREELPTLFALLARDMDLRLS